MIGRVVSTNEGSTNTWLALLVVALLPALIWLVWGVESPANTSVVSSSVNDAAPREDPPADASAGLKDATNAGRVMVSVIQPEGAGTNAHSKDADGLRSAPASVEIRGRVLDAEGAHGVPFAVVEITPLFGSPEHSSGTTVDGVVDEQGYFVVHPRNPTGTLCGVALTVRDADGHGSRDLVIDATMIATREWGYELGNIYLSESRDLDVLVADTSGRPVPLAVVFPVDQFGRESEPTDVNGRVALMGVSESLATVGAVAVGYSVGESSVVKDGVTRIELVRANWIEVRLIGTNDRPVSDLKIRLVSSQPLCGDGKWGPDGAYRFVTVSQVTNRSTGRLEFSPLSSGAPDATSRFLVVDLSPAVSFELQVIDGDREVLSKHAQSPIGADERRLVTIDVQAGGR